MSADEIVNKLDNIDNKADIDPQAALEEIEKLRQFLVEQYNQSSPSIPETNNNNNNNSSDQIDI